ncbi:MAG TPA: winged helix-turn-helix domain-containing protein [Rhodanobacter sp.]|nr:winged helix-turn-helix domain-containing protein [Rhodanobacter sp.]
MGDDRIPMHPQAHASFAFADVAIDVDAHRLTRGGREVAIEPKAFAVLLEFVAHPGQLRSRDELLDAVWGHAFVTPGTLNRLVALLRRALGDDSENPHCIQTVHRLGYRFIAPLQNVVDAAAPALRFAPPPRAHVPQRTEPLIGRERDLDELGRLLQEARLVTVTGAGGIGKTQAALEVARRTAVDFPDGVWLFDCSLQDDGEAMVQWLAGMFFIRATGGTDELMLRLGELLQTRRALLLFDNGERVAEPLGKIAEMLLGTCPELRMLVTSQHRLNCLGESIYWLPPLDLPPSGEWTTEAAVASLSRVPAVQLLLERSRAFASSFALTTDNASAVVEISRRMEGLPLALEIAAARLRVLSPEQLLTRMGPHFLSLAKASASKPVHHRTLHALIEWSYSLLSEREQALLRGLGVFVGTCTLGGACAVGAAVGLDDGQVLDLLGGLIDKSLLVVDATTNPPSYRLLDSVRLFAQEKLAESGDETCVRDAHLEHFIELAERVNAEIRSDRQQLWFDRVKREWANLRAAFDHALSRPGRVERTLALVGNLCCYLRMCSDYAQSARWIDTALRAAPAPTRSRAQALVTIGIMYHHAGVHEHAGTCLREGIALAMQFGDPWLAGTGQAVLAFELATCGDFPGAERCVALSLAVAEARDDAWLRSMALLSRGIACALNDRYRDAEAWLDEACAAAAMPGSGAFQQAYSLINRALLRFYLGELSGAAQDWLFVLDAFVGLQHWRGAAGCIEGTAYLAAERGDTRRAARFLAAAAHVRVLTDAPLMPQWRKAQVVAERKAHEGLGTDYEAVQREAAAERFEAIVAEARVALTTIAHVRRRGASSSSGS